MRQLIKIILSSFVLIGLMAGLVPSGAVIYGHAEGPPHEEAEQKPANDPQVYSFVTPVGCSLSLLARRSLQLYDQQAQDISLSPAQAMFAETNIVKQLGERWLEVGEKVSFDRKIVEDYAKMSQSLTPEQTTAWQGYADTADFNIASINPESTPAATEPPATGDTGRNEAEDKSPGSTEPEAKSSSPAWYLWLLVGAALGGMYLWMDRPRKK